MTKIATYISAIVLSGTVAGCFNETQPDEALVKPETDKVWPKLDIAVKTDPAVEMKVQQIIEKMTLGQKVAQMIQPEIRDVTVEDMRQYGFGSYLNGGGAFPDNNKHATPADWIKLAEDMYQASVDDSLDGSTIPTMWGTDAVHGHNNVIGATLFPHNIGLGAANNPQLIEKIAAITATEVMVTGIDWVFAPTVAAVRDDRWGRTYEGYSEDPEIIKDYAAAIVRGLQGEAGKDFLSDNRVISTVKHFVGDGGTVGGDDQGNNISSELELYNIHAQGYVGGLTAGAQSVMASFNSWHGEKMHGHKYLLTDVLKDKMGFDGFVVGDWNGHGQVAGCDNTSCAQSINAGLDIFMVPTDWKKLYENTIAQVEQGIIPMSRIDDAVSRIVRVKVRAGLFDKPSPAKRKFSGKTELIGADTHRKVARQAVRESLVLLKNKQGVLPLNPALNVLVAGDAADNIGKQSGGWSITWQGTNNTNVDFPGGHSIYDGLKQQIEAAGGQINLSVDGQYQRKPDVAIAVFGEEPYAEGVGDRDSLEYQPGDKSDLALLKKLKSAGIPVVAVFISGRPMWVNAEMNAADAFVAAWLPGSEGQGVADLLLANKDGSVQYDFTGRLSYSWPKSPTQIVNRYDEIYDPLLAYGFGLSYGDENVLADDLVEQVGDLNSQVTTRKIYSGSLTAPWKMRLRSGEKTIDVSASSHEMNGLSYRTIDKNVQEDAVRLQLKGIEDSGLAIVSENQVALDLSSDVDAKSALTFKLNQANRPTDSVILSMTCSQSVDCKSNVDITKYLNQITLGQWAEFSIDLSCFALSGARMTDIIGPFEVSSKGQLDLSLADVEIIPGTAKEAIVNCQ